MGFQGNRLRQLSLFKGPGVNQSNRNQVRFFSVSSGKVEALWCMHYCWWKDMPVCEYEIYGWRKVSKNAYIYRQSFFVNLWTNWFKRSSLAAEFPSRLTGFWKYLEKRGKTQHYKYMLGKLDQVEGEQHRFLSFWVLKRDSWLFHGTYKGKPPYFKIKNLFVCLKGSILYFWSHSNIEFVFRTVHLERFYCTVVEVKWKRKWFFRVFQYYLP